MFYGVIHRLQAHRLRRLLGPGGANLNRPHQALGDQQRNIGLEALFQRRPLHRLQQRFDPFDRAEVFIRQRIEQVVQVGMPDLRHLQRILRTRVGRGKHHHVVVGAVVAGVGFIRIAQEIQINRERAPQKSARLHLQVDIGVEDHLRQRHVIAFDQRGVVGPVPLPDRVQSRLVVERLQHFSKPCNRHRIRRQVVLLDAGKKVGRPLQIQRQRHVLRQIVRSIPSPVPHIPVAHRGHRRLRICRVPEVLLHLGPDVEPLRIGDVQPDFVTASIHRRQHGEQGLVGIQGDGIIVVRRTQRRQQPQTGRHHPRSKPITHKTTQEETTQESLPHDGHPTATITIEDRRRTSFSLRAWRQRVKHPSVDRLGGIGPPD